MATAFLALSLLSAHAASAEAGGMCEALPPRVPMPREALPASLDIPSWQAQVDGIKAHLPAMYLRSRKLVFIGDSLLFNWKMFIHLYSEFYRARAPLNLGVFGDRTSGVLSRIPAEWQMLNPLAAVLLVGTNDTAQGSKPADVALAIAEVVRLIHRQSPGTRVLVVGILPRGLNPSPLRELNSEVNALIARCADGVSTFYVDVSAALLNSHGQFTSDVSTDQTHLTPAGYLLFAQALEPMIKKLMDE